MTTRPYRTGPSLQVGIPSAPPVNRIARPWRRRLWAVSAAAAMLLAACGGGGDDGSGRPQDYAVSAAMGQWLTEAHSWVVTGTGSSGKSYTVNIALAPMAPAPIPVVGGVAARSQQTFAATIDGATFEGALTYYFDAATLTFIATDNGTGGCSVASAATALPGSARVGATGPVSTDSNYDSCTSDAAVVSTSTNTWSLENTAGVVLLCLKQNVLDLTGTSMATQSTCVEIAPDGSLGSKARLVVTAVGLTLIDARNF